MGAAGPARGGPPAARPLGDASDDTGWLAWLPSHWTTGAPLLEEGRAIAEQRFPNSDAVREWALKLVNAHPSIDGDGVVSRLHRVCDAAVVGIGMTGAVVNMRSPRGPEAIVALSGPVGAVAELEFDLGEGPTRDSWDTGRPQFVSDLAHAQARWVAFAPAAIEAGVQAVYALPLQIGAARFGAFTLFCSDPRQLTAVEASRALALAELATELLLDSVSDTPDGGIDPDLESALDVRSEIYQAQGMLMVSLRVGLAEALARMRAHAFVAGRDLVEVAGDIIAGRLDLNDDRPKP